MSLIEQNKKNQEAEKQKSKTDENASLIAKKMIVDSNKSHERKTLLQNIIKSGIEKNASTIKEDLEKKVQEMDAIEFRTNTIHFESKETDILKKYENDRQKLLFAFTKKFENQYELDYGRHEYDVGLGEIAPLSWLSIKVTQNGQTFKAFRGRNQYGRIGYFTANPPPTKEDYKGGTLPTFDHSQYLATYTGDRFEKSDLSIEEKNKKSALATESLYRLEYKSKKTKKPEFDEDISYTNYSSDKSYETNTKYKHKESKESPIEDNNFIDKLNKYREENDGQQILEHGRKACDQYGIEFPIYKSLILSESAGKFDAINKNTKATGYGQFLEGAWTDFKKYLKRNPKIFEENKNIWKADKIEDLKRINPYANAFATAWYLKNISKGVVTSNMSIKEKAIRYAFLHHDGPGGGRESLRFLEDMRKLGATTEEEIRREYNKNPNKYFTKWKWQKDRGMKGFFHLYNSYVLVIANRAAKSKRIEDSPSSKKQSQEEMSSVEVSYKSSSKSGEGTNTTPRRTQYGQKGKLGSYSTAYPGLRKNKEGKRDFDAEQARSQLKSLKRQGVTTIVSLARNEKGVGGKKTWNQYKEIISELGLKHISNMTIVDNNNNHQIFEKLGGLIKNGEKLMIHCRNNAHRAPTATIGAWLASGAASSFEEALSLAGVTSKHDFHEFHRLPRARKFFITLLNFARKKNIPIRKNYDKIIKGPTKKYKNFDL